MNLDDKERKYIERNAMPLWFIVFCCIGYGLLVLSVVYSLLQAVK